MPAPRVAPAALALCLLAGVPAAAGAQGVVEDIDTVLARGLELHQAGDVLGAIQAYEEVLARDPSRGDARSNLGAAYARLGRYDEAISQYGKALAIVPDDAAVRFNLALALYKGARMREAADELKVVLARDPGHKNALLVLADAHLELGEDAAVVDVLTPYEGRYGDDRAFAYLFGTALIRLGQLERGQGYIDRLLRLGDSSEARILMGAAHLMGKEYPEALKELKRALEINANIPGLHSLYGRALLGSGDREGAARAFRSELEMNPNDFMANLHLGLLRKNDQRHDEALAYLTRARRMRSQDPSVRYALGSLYMATGRVDEARHVLEDLVKEVPQYVEAHVLLATVYYRLKRKEDGDRERAIVQKLNAEIQTRAPGAQDTLGPAYRGEELPRPGPPAPSPAPRKKPE